MRFAMLFGRWMGWVLLCVAVSWGWARPARACGGFFCNQVTGTPVNQAAERIIFSKNADGTVTAIVQIMYSGPSEAFAWVLPVPGTPDVKVSSDAAFQRLQVATNPVYQLNTSTEGDCFGGDDGISCGGADSAVPSVSDAGFGDAGVAGEPPVTIEDAGRVGPYDYVTISLDPALPNPGDVAVDWLLANGYEVDDFGRERLGPYLADGLNLIAFRLTKDRDAGSVRPIFITYPDDEPMIPIRPTAVAAEDDMGILVWVLGDSRAVPANYASLELNEALIDWFSPGDTYDDVVTAAANEAGGQGFVTEMSQATDAITGVVVTDAERNAWGGIRGTDWSASHVRLLEEAHFLLSGWDGYADVVRRLVPVPLSTTQDELVRCPHCVWSRADGTIDGFDPQAYLDALDAEVVQPMVQTQELIDAHPHVTRLYTTMSAHEMTMDPIFGFNPSLEDVSNTHTADRIIECNLAGQPWRVELDSGDVVRGTGTTWPLSPDDPAHPKNRRVLDLDRTGMGSVIVDNTGAVAAALEDHNRTTPGGTPAGGGSCSAAVPIGRVGWAAFGLFVLVMLLRPRGGFPGRPS